jgi:putative lipoic acid-binding regulatory protein
MSDDTLLEFPCDFPLKVMGRKADDFAALVVQLVESHAGPIPDTRVSQRLSRDGNFVALTVVVRADSKPQLDAIYAELSAHERVLMVL